MTTTAPPSSTNHTTLDLHIESLRPLIPPAILLEEIPLSSTDADRVTAHRRAIAEVLHGRDARMVVVVGPCSIHDPAAALEYAARLRALSAKLENDLLIVMRVYFEKPRTTVGWKGLINDPRLDGSFAINEGLRTARRLLREIVALGLPAGCEFLDPISPQFTTIWYPGARSARARRRARCTASSRPAFRCRSASRTARMATSASPSTA